MPGDGVASVKREAGDQDRENKKNLEGHGKGPLVDAKCEWH